MNEYYFSPKITRDLKYCPCKKQASFTIYAKTHSNKIKYMYEVCEKCKQTIEPVLSSFVSIVTAKNELLDTRLPNDDPCAWDCRTVADMWGYV